MRRRLALAFGCSLLFCSVAAAAVGDWNQRRSLMTIGMMSMPQPNGELDSGDRAQLIGIFRGQLEPGATSTGATAVGGCTAIRTIWRQRTE